MHCGLSNKYLEEPVVFWETETCKNKLEDYISTVSIASFLN